MDHVAIPANRTSDPAIVSQRRALDRLGIGLGGLCAVHCLAAVVLVSVFGIGGHLLLAPAIHHVGLVLAVIVAAIAIGWGTLGHRRTAPSIVAVAGLGFMVLALMVPHGEGEFALTLIGVVLVSAGHVLNLRASHRNHGAAAIPHI